MINMLTRIQQLVSEKAEIPEIKPDEDIYDAGLDSMAAMDLMLSLEEEFGVTLGGEFLQARTCEQLAHVVERVGQQ